jgi:hypothetical protein
MPWCPSCRREMRRISEGGHRVRRFTERLARKGPNRARQMYWCPDCNLVLSSDQSGRVRVTEYAPGGRERPKRRWWPWDPLARACFPHSRRVRVPRRRPAGSPGTGGGRRRAGVS